MFVPATGRCRCPGDRATTFPARRDAARCTAPGRRIPAGCILVDRGGSRCLTGRISRRRLSHALHRKERASAAQARPDKAVTEPAGGRNGRGMPEVTKLKHPRRGTRRPRNGGALRNKAEQWSAEFLPAAGWPIGPVRRGNSRGGQREMFHALYMPGGGKRHRPSLPHAGRGGRSHGYTATPLHATSRDFTQPRATARPR